MKYTCPCCGYKTLDEEPRGSCEIRPVCFWETDYIQFDDSDYEGGPNVVSLRQGQQNFIKQGYSDERIKDFVRPPNSNDIKDENWKPY
jgi:hypothetical protein